MKWVSKLSLALAGAMLAIASRPVAAYPVIRLGGPDATLTALESESKVEALLALLTNPTASAANAPLAHHVGRLSALKAMSLGGLGGIGELTACHIDAVNGVALAL